jgi:PTS system N-acetylglucosamine-specific IIC component
VRLGFGFSAGLFDYVLNFTHAQRPLLLIPIGAAYFGLYYVVFRVCIVRLNLATPGRGADEVNADEAAAPAGGRAEEFVTALGGAGNLTEVAACTTRLRLILSDNTLIDEPSLKRLGARGVLRSGTDGLQVVLGPIADQVAGEIRAALRAEPRTAPHVQVPRATPHTDAASLLTALGGRQNVVAVESLAGRLSLRLADLKAVDESGLTRLGVRGIAHSAANSIQVLMPTPVADWMEPLQRLVQN